MNNDNDELIRLRELAAACYAGLVAECDLPEKWADVFLSASTGEPFSTEGLLPFTPRSSVQGEAECPHEAWEENGGWCRCVDCGHGWRADATTPPAPAAEQAEDHEQPTIALALWIVSNLLNESQLSVIPPGYNKSLRYLLLEEPEDRAIQPEPVVEGVDKLRFWIARDVPESCVAETSGRAYSVRENLLCLVDSLATPNPVRAEQPEGKGMKVGDTIMVPAYVAYPGSRVSDLLIGGRDGPFVQVPNSMLAAAPAAPGVRVDEAMVYRASTAYDRWMINHRPGQENAWQEAMRDALTAALAGKDGA